MDDRRARRVEQVRVPPGPLAELKALLYELYTSAGEPSLSEIAAWVKADGDLAGSPGRDTIHRLLREAQVPSSQADVVAVATVLARVARWDPRDAAGRARDLWFAARMVQPLGIPLEHVTDPFALEVHKPIQLTDHDTDTPALLPVYVPRAHDARLAEVVDRVLTGESVMAVLVAGSSAGKTRAGWEALHSLREAGGWRLWHPYHPGRVEAALARLDEVGPRTVVWLNETQNYLAGSDGERVAAGLRALLTNPSRGPVLVLGTLWPDYYTALTRDTASQVRHVLADTSTVIEVPYTFTGADHDAMRATISRDPRLAWATEHATDGQITQYLAGAPELLDRLRTATDVTKALIRAAMDLRRLGHRNALPVPLIEAAAEAQLTDLQLDQLNENSWEQALANAAKPCKGAPGPLARIRPDRTRQGRHSRTTHSEPIYQLADYLDQHGRAHRRDTIPPVDFWAAAATYAHPGDLGTLAQAAQARGLYRDAAQLYKNATSGGDSNAAPRLIKLLHSLQPTNIDNGALWIATHGCLDDPDMVADLLGELHRVGAAEQVAVLAERVAVAAAAGAPLDDPEGVARLLAELRRVGAAEQVAVLAERAAAGAPLDDLRGVARLLGELREFGATEQVAVLAERAAGGARLDDPQGVANLLGELREFGATEQTMMLAQRLPAAGHFRLFMTIDDHAERFRFGRELDTTAAMPWAWEDLE